MSAYLLLQEGSKDNPVITEIEEELANHNIADKLHNIADKLHNIAYKLQITRKNLKIHECNTRVHLVFDMTKIFKKSIFPETILFILVFKSFSKFFKFRSFSFHLNSCLFNFIQLFPSFLSSL